jgi:chloramphenicol-sensitive protein RarD
MIVRIVDGDCGCGISVDNRSDHQRQRPASRHRLAEVASTTAAPSTATEDRRGVLYGVAAYGVWGLFPLYWVLLKPAGAVEVLAHRIVWTLAIVLAILWLGTWLATRPAARRSGERDWSTLRAVLRDRRRLGLLIAAAALISVNWGTYIWGVTNGHVVETSLGYFINPLVTVLAGVLVLGERLRSAQWAAVGLGALAVLVLTAGYGRLPWIALILAGCFGSYGLIKKYVAVGAVESLAVETAVLFGPALGCLVVLEASGSGTFFDYGVSHAVLLATGGLVTAVPLLAFGAAANRIPLSVLGLVQYLAPVLQFVTGVLVFGEHMPPARWFGFVLVWLALSVLTWDGLRAARRRGRAAAAVEPCEPT